MVLREDRFLVNTWIWPWNCFVLSEASLKDEDFYLLKIYASPDVNILAVEGCYWGCPTDIIFYDFSDPSIIPLLEIDRIENIWESLGWETSNTFAVRAKQVIRKSDGELYKNLSHNEQKKIL